LLRKRLKRLLKKKRQRKLLMMPIAKKQLMRKKQILMKKKVLKLPQKFLKKKLPQNKKKPRIRISPTMAVKGMRPPVRSDDQVSQLCLGEPNGCVLRRRYMRMITRVANAW